MGIADWNYEDALRRTEFADCVQQCEHEWDSADNIRVSPFNEVNDIGGFNTWGSSMMFTRLCCFIDNMEHRNLVDHRDFMTVAFDGQPIVPCTVASHMAYFFAANPRYGISPKRAVIVSKGWVEDHPDVINDGATPMFRAKESEGFAGHVFDWAQRSEVLPRFSFVFKHDDGLDCFYRALGIRPPVPAHIIPRLKRLVDARVANEAFVSDRNMNRRVWVEEWQPGMIRDGQVLWRALQRIEADWDHIVSCPYGTRLEYDSDMLDARLGHALTVEDGRQNESALERYRSRHVEACC